MPELPEVEVLARHLAPLLRGRTVTDVRVHREKSVRPATAQAFRRRLLGVRCLGLRRRAKYLVFELRAPNGAGRFSLLGHLGMTGRMYLQAQEDPLPKHAAVTLRLDRQTFVFEDTRYFGRLSLDLRPLESLGPEPLEAEFTVERLDQALRRSRQPIKVRLLDQTLVVGLGNIYASEVLFRARIPPRRAANRLTAAEIRRLRDAIRRVLAEAIDWGSTVPLNWSGRGQRDRLFYYGRAPGTPDGYSERLCVYDRAGLPCVHCRGPVRRIVQAGRSTYFCPHCQRG
jgi:formamidopyrimidine-DNA glycosylase